MSILDRIQQILAAELAAKSAASSHARSSYVQPEALDDDEDLRKAIEDAVVQSRERRDSDVVNACTLLALPEAYTADQLRSAWRAALLKWHPDLYVNGTPSEQQHASDQTRAINSAYFFLRSRL